MSAATIRLILGAVAIGITLNHWFHLTTRGALGTPAYPPFGGTIAGATTGFLFLAGIRLLYAGATGL